MKPLVLASYAQFGVGWREACEMPACGCRAPLNGMRDPTLLPWRPAVVHRRTPPVVSDLCTRQLTSSTPMARNLHRGATRPLCRERCVQSSLPCVGRVDREVEAPVSPARETVLIPLKPWLQKRLRDGLTAVEIT